MDIVELYVMDIIKLFSILVALCIVMLIIGFVVDCCVGTSGWLAWSYKAL